MDNILCTAIAWFLGVYLATTLKRRDRLFPEGKSKFLSPSPNFHSHKQSRSPCKVPDTTETNMTGRSMKKSDRKKRTRRKRRNTKNNVNKNKRNRLQSKATNHKRTKFNRKKARNSGISTKKYIGEEHVEQKKEREVENV